MAIGVILSFLKANWLPVLLGLVVLGTVGYIKVIKLERDHYKTEYTTLNVKYAKLVTDSKETQDLLKQGAEEVTAKYKNTLATANTLVTVNARLNSENIKNAKELADTKLSLTAIRLFNASKQSTPVTSTPVPVVGNAGSTTTSPEASVVAPQDTLADLLQVVNTNDANHLKCIATVEQWQGFWHDYTIAVEAANARIH